MVLIAGALATADRAVAPAGPVWPTYDASAAGRRCLRAARVILRPPAASGAGAAAPSLRVPGGNCAPASKRAVPRSLSAVRRRMTALRKPFRRFVDSQKREARHVIRAAGCSGLMPLLMKPRNGSQWSTEERPNCSASFAARRASPYLLFLLLLALALLFAAYAWWLDRRRDRRLGRRTRHTAATRLPAPVAASPPPLPSRGWLPDSPGSDAARGRS